MAHGTICYTCLRNRGLPRVAGDIIITPVEFTPEADALRARGGASDNQASSKSHFMRPAILWKAAP